MSYMRCSSGGNTQKDIDFSNPLLELTPGGGTDTSGNCTATKNGKILIIISSSSINQSFSVKKNDVSQSENYRITSRNTNTTERVYYFDVAEGDSIACTMYSTNNYNSTLSVFQ